MDWYLRPSKVVAISRDTSFLFVVPGRGPVVLDEIDVDAMASVLALCARPVDHATLAEASSEEAIEKLVGLGVLERGTQDSLVGREPTRQPIANKRCRHVVVALSGAVSVTGAIERATAIADLFADEVDVVISEGARQFIQPRVVEYHGLRAWLDPFEPAHGAPVPHEYLAQKTDLVLVSPASASMLHRLASGECSDLTSLIVAATKAPVIVVPAMNPQMWLHPPIQRNVQQLREDGIWVVEPGLGFIVAQRDQGGVGGGGVDRDGLLRALDAILTMHAAARG